MPIQIPKFVKGTLIPFFLRGQMTRLMYVATGVERHLSFCPRQKR